MSHLKFIYQEMCWQPLCETVSLARCSCRAQAVKCSPIYWTWDRLQSYLIVAGQELQILWRWSWWVLVARWETAIVSRASKHFNLHSSDAVYSLKVSNTKPKVTLDGLKDQCGWRCLILVAAKPLLSVDQPGHRVADEQVSLQPPNVKQAVTIVRPS